MVGKSVPNFKALASGEVAANVHINASLTAGALTASKYVGKGVGGANLVSMGYSVYQDCETYDGDNLAYAITADATTGLIGIGVAVTFSVFAVGVVGSIVGGIVAAGIASYVANTFKEGLEKNLNR